MQKTTKNNKKLVNGHIGNNIKRLREWRRWTQAELAWKSGTTAIAMVESGKRNPRIKTLAAIANALGVSMECLVRVRKTRNPGR